MVKRQARYRGSRSRGINHGVNSGHSGLSRKAGKILIRQLILCLIIVFLAIVVKKMDHAMTNRALETVQTFMAQDHTPVEAGETVKSVFASLSALPETVETAIEKSRTHTEYIQPTNEEALVMTFGGDTYEGLRYSSVSELQVYASSGGTVIAVEGEPGSQRIRISHGGEVETQYAGCTEVYVSPLQKVRKGELIASVAPADQSCLTFSMWKDGRSLDPADYIRF